MNDLGAQDLQKQQLHSECHLHLYGCLPKETVFELGDERRKLYPTRFQWFLSEFQKNTGEILDPTQWWGPGGEFEAFKKDFLCTGPAPFEVFQAKFNLLIALFPATPDDMTLSKKVFEHHAKDGGYKEYRTFLPMILSVDDHLRVGHLSPATGYFIFAQKCGGHGFIPIFDAFFNHSPSPCPVDYRNRFLWIRAEP